MVNYNIENGKVVITDRDLAEYIEYREEQVARLQDLQTTLDSLIKQERQSIDELIHLQYEVWALHE